ncbi:host specificity factor TipJ family phage tail protein [Roseovarius autotrophicus]|uniref:host specificity factor TipJ family phage tail protein n=1 Tax=Roseovarius autotrophicus TaxID=2824121 RepID=UPI001B3888DD|nr:host specificity factor TipJ family phage tail protein [Roseovarius autotrophicus]
MPASRSLASEIAPLIGIPWQAGASGPDAYDCWAAAAMVEARLFGRALPGLTPERRRGIASARQVWALSRIPRNGDIVEMRRMGRANHVGVWIEGGILHCQAGAGMVYDQPSDIRLMGWTMRYWTPAPRRVRKRRCPAPRAVYVPGLDLLMAGGAAVAEDLLAAHRAVPVQARTGDSIAEAVARAGLGGEPLAAFLRPHGARDDVHLPENVTDESLAALLRDLGAVPVEAWEMTRIGADQCLVLTALPQGGGGSNPLATILSIAVIAAAFFVAGPLGLGATLGSTLGIGAAGTTLAFGAVSALGQFVVSTLLPPPSPRGVGKFSEDISPTFSASAQSSIARPGAPIPIQFGRHIHLLDDVAPPFSRFEDNKQIICQLLALGMGEHALEEVRLGDTAVWREGALTGTLPGVAIEHVPSGNAVTLFEEAVWTQGDVAGLTLDPDSMVGWHAAVPRGRRAEAVEVDIVFQQLVTIDNNGNNQNRTVQIRVEAQQVDDDDVALGDVIELETLGFTAATRSPLRSSHKWFVPPGRWRLRLTRLTAEGGDQTFDTALWGGLKGILPGGRILAGLELLAVRVEVGEQFAAQSARQVQAVKTRKLPVWTGSGWSAPEPTREIAWAVAEVARAHGRLGDLDMGELLALHEVWTARGDRFDTVFDQSMSFWEALQAVLRAGRAQADQIGRRIRLWRDAPQPVPRQLFCERNIRRGSLVVRPRLPVSDRPERLVAQYMDARTWRPAELTIGAITGRERRERYFGITDRAHLLREVGHDLRAARFRTVEVEFEVELENRLLRRGDAIVLSHFELTEGLAIGLDDWRGLTLTLGRAVDLSGWPGNAIMTLSAPDGAVIGPFRVARPITDRTDTLTIDPDEMDRITADHGTDPRAWLARSAARDEPIRAVLGREAGIEMRLIVQSVTQERQGLARVVCIDDDPRAHDLPVDAAGDLDGAIIGLTLDTVGTPGGTELQIEVALRAGFDGADILYEYSADGGAIWQPLGQGGAMFTAPLPQGLTHIRVAVIVQGARGAWVSAAIAQAGLAAPAPAAEVIPGRYAAEAVLHVTAAPVAGATSYRFELRGVAQALLAIQFRAAPEIVLDRDQLAALGALTRHLTLRVAALDADAIAGPFVEIDLTVPAPVAVTGLVSPNGNRHVWTVPAPPPPFGWRVRWRQRASGGFTGETVVANAEWFRSSASWPNLVWVAGLDVFGPGPEAFIDHTPPPADDGK